VFFKFASIGTLVVTLAVLIAAGRGYAEDYRYDKPTMFCEEEECTGTEGRDFIYGDTTSNEIHGLAGADDIDGNGGIEHDPRIRTDWLLGGRGLAEPACAG
jgi:hypothetical protein